MNISVKKNPCLFGISDLIEIGKRANNPKRNFLFISKLLGKHIAVNPDICKTAGWLLASLAYNEPCSEYSYAIKNSEHIDAKIFDKPIAKEDVLVMGFCETATGLGMAVASAIEGSLYFHTTREKIDGIKPLFSFEEEHSHATTHLLYTLRQISCEKYSKVILVDDEITTGNSMLNIIKAIKTASKIKNFHILTILDWRDEEQLNKFDDFCKENDVKITVTSAMAGSISGTTETVYHDARKTPVIEDTASVDCEIKEFPSVKLGDNDNCPVSYFSASGRFGVEYSEIQEIEEHSERVAKKINEMLPENAKVLVLGHGENIYIPSRIASKISAAKVDFRTTSRSPICVDGSIINDKQAFYDRGEKYYFYNRCDAENEYDVVLLLTETPLNVKLCNNQKLISL